ncbi:CAP domain-containing protein [Bacillus sp. 31A1R]|uniref:CAP domain-containing protein n=1 Tax=Robertmurraya mangrovi TaxID=3098077 RepID=A0ABU5J5F3_9BACI|nr:CAP domain-containing protein [Bacillus sp. 31A1R]MDZ5474633.1 CAP domain-containing protein [Bacillus sp. 31A1R]
MKKKVIFSVAAAAALLLTNPGVNQAEASTDTTSTKVYYYQTSNLDYNQLNSLLQKYFSRVTTQNPATQVTNETQPAPTQQPAASQETSTTTTTTTGATSYQLSAYEQKVVELTNQERAKYGLVGLKIDAALSKVAREKSSDMQRNNYFSHTSPTYGSPFDMMKKFGITYRTAGENIAMGQRTPEEVVKAWMNSEGHRKNILNANFTHIGVGHVASGNYWTQMFIGK